MFHEMLVKVHFMKWSERKVSQCILALVSISKKANKSIPQQQIHRKMSLYVSNKDLHKVSMEC